MKKFVLEIGCPSYYAGYGVEKRILFDTLDEANREFQRILHENYTDEELADDEIQDECSGNCNPDCEYIDDWEDEEQDVYLFIYQVETYEKEEA